MPAHRSDWVCRRSKNTHPPTPGGPRLWCLNRLMAFITRELRIVLIAEDENDVWHSSIIISNSSGNLTDFWTRTKLTLLSYCYCID